MSPLAPGGKGEPSPAPPFLPALLSPQCLPLPPLPLLGWSSPAPPSAQTGSTTPGLADFLVSTVLALLGAVVLRAQAPAAEASFVPSAGEEAAPPDARVGVENGFTVPPELSRVGTGLPLRGGLSWGRSSSSSLMLTQVKQSVARSPGGGWHAVVLRACLELLFAKVSYSLIVENHRSLGWNICTCSAERRTRLFPARSDCSCG